MEYSFLDSSIDIENVILPTSDLINPFLLKNNYAEIIKGVDFINSEDSFLYVHGFLGTGKRQFVNYIAQFADKNVIRLEYYCKASTVCDDILLNFIDKIDKNVTNAPNNINAKITTLSVKFNQYINLIKRPFLIIIHSYDDILEENIKLVQNMLSEMLEFPNVKIIMTTRAMHRNILGEGKSEQKIFLKSFSKDIFREFLKAGNVEASDKVIEDFYKYTRGYYYYTALSIKIINAMKISLSEFLQKFTQSSMDFDSYLGLTYVNLIPNTIRNFFWFLRTMRHGLTMNALAIFELYDEFSIEYLKTNLMVFVSDETVYVQDYFQQNIDVSIPEKTEIKLHKYIISIYEKLLKEPLQTRSVLISRQAMRAEMEYHNKCIEALKSGKQQAQTAPKAMEKEAVKTVEKHETEESSLITKARNLALADKKTEAIEEYLKIMGTDGIDLQTLNECRLEIARLYKDIREFKKSEHYYELVENFYKKNNEVINMNYLLYEETDLYNLMYKNERAVETIKKVIYSVDTPQSLMVSSCTLLGNIYSDLNNPDEAYTYYKKALESLEENTPNEVLAELYFKYALANDDRDDEQIAFQYYNKCIALPVNSPYKALAYSNMASCYFENNNYSDAKNCFEKAYDIEKSNNNYDGIYYTASNLAKIYLRIDPPSALNYLIEAKQCAEFLNESFYILESTLALGDYYYNNISMNKKALHEYFKAKKTAQAYSDKDDIQKIDLRIEDMKLRMSTSDFEEIQKIYE